MKNSYDSSINLIKGFIREIVSDYSMAGSRRFDAPGNIRSGFNVVGSRGNVLADVQGTEEKKKRETVRILIIDNGGNVLAVAEHDNDFHIGLPGGGIDPGETEEEAAIRELWEETGLIVNNLTKINKSEIDIGPVTLFQAFEVEGKLRGSSEGKVLWVKPNELLNGKFSSYYQKVFNDICLL